MKYQFQKLKYSIPTALNQSLSRFKMYGILCVFCIQAPWPECKTASVAIFKAEIQPRNNQRAGSRCHNPDRWQSSQQTHKDVCCRRQSQTYWCGQMKELRGNYCTIFSLIDMLMAATWEDQCVCFRVCVCLCVRPQWSAQKPQFKFQGRSPRVFLIMEAGIITSGPGGINSHLAVTATSTSWK